ncbi:unnamed protein product [Chondrus crispus]|uniref:Uncharacterized protein n=1 Tax=Chondrus crispus TaxID=2769 RepID=R7Q8R0_CHOCR|nr:unnamed protein product [Chondrus crispus]CDF34188.1 unnamed protein product [Chondrus crispus]|eukprot:XP_005714007.1 unnamed protein product [Chondrus crispus]
MRIDALPSEWSNFSIASEATAAHLSSCTHRFASPMRLAPRQAWSRTRLGNAMTCF